MHIYQNELEIKLKKRKDQCVIVIYVFKCTESVLIFFFLIFLQKVLKGKESNYF